MRLATAVTVLLSAPSLLAAAHVAPSATAPAEVVKWTAGVSYSYDSSGNITRIGDDQFLYDKVGRLAEAQVNGVQRTYRYDAFGNRIACTHMPGTSSESDCQFGVQIDSATNRTKGAQHDGRGNVKTFGGHAYTYDDTDMPVRDDGGAFSREFVYTADGERLATFTIGGETKWTLRDLSGKVLREVASNAAGTSFTWKKDYVYRDGQLLASRHVNDAAPVTYHYHLDHIGSPRRITDHNNRLAGFHDYFAFGPEVPGGLTEPVATSLKYTGHERDLDGIEGLATLDYMHARYYSPAAARFLSVDRGDSERLGFPQTWNRYAYALNSPIRVFDPDGREWRKFADKIGITRTLEFLAARSPEVKATLDLHDGPDKPNLEFEKNVELGKLDDGSGSDTKGDFDSNPVSVFTYDFSKATGPITESNLLPLSGQYLATARYEGGKIRFDKSVNLNVNLAHLTKKDKETLRIIIHELGHANLAASNMVLYLQLSAEDKIKNVKHDDREVEKDAINYQKRNCKYPDFCDQ